MRQRGKRFIGIFLIALLVAALPIYPALAKGRVRGGSIFLYSLPTGFMAFAKTYANYDAQLIVDVDGYNAYGARVCMGAREVKYGQEVGGERPMTGAAYYGTNSWQVDGYTGRARANFN